METTGSIKMGAREGAGGRPASKWRGAAPPHIVNCDFNTARRGQPLLPVEMGPVASKKDY